MAKNIANRAANGITKGNRSTAAVASVLWGFAEATLFFIVPDVLLTALVAGRRDAGAQHIALWIATAVVGALLGGWLMFAWAAQDASAAREAVLRVPGISEALRTAVESTISEHGLIGLLTAGWTGVPYKVFAIEAGAANESLGRFLAVSFVARAIRFSATCLITATICATLARHWSRRKRLIVTFIVWALVYSVYAMMLVT